ncbi:hypothetical protein SAY86_032218 [Trapa natans]|uniref:Uncharacterized protein n=1 Tax=Trapa natans TaxID=22666 RepID=A0AAN7LT63_TRANT|nr:hypothetical protein SAY86_032218 [Trapa natans]
MLASPTSAPCTRAKGARAWSTRSGRRAAGGSRDRSSCSTSEHLHLVYAGRVRVREQRCHGLLANF